MKYGVLTQSDNFMYLARDVISLESTGVSKIMIQVADAIDWLNGNQENQLIVTMPLDPTHRKTIEEGLGEYDERCIALEPAMLLQTSYKFFKNTHDLQIGILGQIREIIKKD